MQCGLDILPASISGCDPKRTVPTAQRILPEAGGPFRYLRIALYYSRAAALTSSQPPDHKLPGCPFRPMGAWVPFHFRSRRRGAVLRAIGARLTADFRSDGRE